MIHSTAVVSPNAKLGENVTVGPFCIIGDDVVLGDNCRLESHVVIKGPSQIGAGNHFYQFTSIGEDCQDKKYAGERTELVIGDNNIFRESVTVHRGTIQDQSLTKIGSNNLFMVNAHVAHDCMLGSNMVVANNVMLAGHVHVGDFAIIGGGVAVHQFCKIGAHAFIGGGGIVLRDVLNYVMISGTKNIPQGINSEGLKRRGVSKDAITAIKRAYRTIYRSGLTVDEAVAALQESANTFPEVADMLAFISGSDRGLLR